MLRWRYGPRTAPAPSPLSRASPRPGPRGHDWHSDLSDKYGVSCRGGEDCKPTAMCRLPDGREGIVVLAACRPIPWDKVLGVPSPDGRAHVCAVPSRNGGGVIPFLKVDKGLQAECNGVSLMKPIPALDALLTRAVKLGVFGTKMRSVINLPLQEGIAAVVAQQFDVAAQIAGRGLMPIIEPEVSIKSPDKPGAEAILLAELTRKLDALPDGGQVMLKLTIPDVPDLYSALTNHERVARVVALSGGYTRADACKRLAANHGMIASFSRALAEGLTHSMSDAEFEATLANSIDEIYRASTVKV